jgi:hypothetical protein
MNEVKTREDEYNLVKNISAHIQGLSPSVQLARRERRLLAHGLLRHVGSNDRGTEGDSSYCLGSIRHCGSLSERDDVPDRSSRLIDAINEWNVLRGRSGSVKSTASSATGMSFKTHVTMSSTSSGFPMTPPSDRFSSFCGVVSPPASSTLRTRYITSSKSPGCSYSKDKRSLSTATSQPIGTSMVHAFVFTDLAVFAAPIDPSGTYGEDSTWCLLDDIGLSRVLGITECPNTSCEFWSVARL